MQRLAPARFLVQNEGWLELANTPVNCTLGLRVGTVGSHSPARIGPESTDVYVTLDIADAHGRVYRCERPLTASAMSDSVRYETPRFFTGERPDDRWLTFTSEALSRVQLTWGDLVTVALQRKAEEGHFVPATVSLTSVSSSASLRWRHSGREPDLVLLLDRPSGETEWTCGILDLRHLTTFVLFPEFGTARGRPNGPGPRFVATALQGDPASHRPPDSQR